MHSDGEQLKVWGLDLEREVASPYRNPGLWAPQEHKPRRSRSADKLVNATIDIERWDCSCVNEAGSCQFWVNHADSQQHAPKSTSCSLEAYHRRDATNEIPCITLMRYERTLIRNNWPRNEDQHFKGYLRAKPSWRRQLQVKCDFSKPT